MSKPIRIKGYLPLIGEGETPEDTLRKQVWAFSNKKPLTPYIEISVNIVNHEPNFEGQRQATIDFNNQNA